MPYSTRQYTGLAVSVLSAVFLFHSAYSTYEHFTLNKSVEEKEVVIPLDITLECLFSVLLFVVGSVLLSAPFKLIDMETEMSKLTIDGVDARPSFRMHNHRGVLMFKEQ